MGEAHYHDGHYCEDTITRRHYCEDTTERRHCYKQTPPQTATRFNLGKSSNMAIVLAQLVVDGVRFGLHPFLVPIRSLDDHMPLNGITVGDIGPKMALNSIDNGFLIMHNIRIPRKNMFMKNAEVTPDGKVLMHGVDKANYATMVFVRVKLCKWSFDALADGITTAVRYSAVRRQSSLKPGAEEDQVLNYQSQQYKIFPALAAAYTFLFVHRRLNKYYQRVHAELMADNTTHLAELHCQSSALKAYLADTVVRLLEICRQSCGGHGYLQSAGIGLLCNSALPLVTVEGDNSVLYQQVARYLMKQAARAVAGERTSDAVSYLRLQISDDQPHFLFLGVPDCLNLDKLVLLYQRMAQSTVMRAAKQLQISMEQGQEQHVAWNNNMVNLIKAAVVHSQICALEEFVAELKELRQTASQGVSSVLTSLCQFYALHGIVQDAGNFMSTQTLTPDELEWMQKAELQMLAAIRRDAVPLVDAFDLHDVCLHSALGCYDGNVYNRLYAMAQMSTLNKSQVHPAYYKYQRELMKEGQRLRMQSKL